MPLSQSFPVEPAPQQGHSFGGSAIRITAQNITASFTKSVIVTVEPKSQSKVSLASGLLFLAGPCVAAIVSLIMPHSLNYKARNLAGVTVWMALWWMTEVLPMGVTSLLPIVVFPMVDIMNSADVVPNYSKTLIWLFFGGFQLAFALEKAGLHKRCAFGLLKIVGTRPNRMLLGFMLSVGLLSMFLSNTSTTLMILPVAQAVHDALEGDQDAPGAGSFGKALMLGIAYSASTGGLGTIIGTPPNGVMAEVGKEFGIDIGFAEWMAFAAPLAVIMVFLLWVYLGCLFKVSREDLGPEHPVRAALSDDLGPMSQAEVLVAVVFFFTVVAWMTRKPVVEALGWDPARIGDETIAIAATFALFMIPARDGMTGKLSYLTDWQTLLKTQWDVLFLFGGGFALAAGFSSTGLSAWIGGKLAGLGGLPLPVLVLATVLMVTFLTEVTSNTATATVLLPIIGSLACEIGVPPATLMIPATLAASCAFMLPVATAPNAIVFATGLVKMTDMATTGLAINLASSLLITGWMFTWGTFTLNTDSTCPDTNVSALAAAMPLNMTWLAS